MARSARTARRVICAVGLLPGACAPARSAPAPAAVDVVAGPPSATAAPAAVARAPVVLPDEATIVVNGAPPITIRKLGAALIEVGAAASTQTIELERTALSDDGRRVVQRGTLASRATRALHTARPGTTYTYRARVSGAWSEPASLYVATPGAPPPPPASPSVHAETPFAVRVAWQAEPRDTAGFEVQVEKDGAFVRAGLVDPTAREFVHHLRVPGQQLAYRVRAFNTRGASPPSPVVTITMPGSGAGARAKTMPPAACIRAVKPPAQDGCSPETDAIETPGGGVLYNVPGWDSSCRRHLMGDYQGCRRDFGAFELQADVTAVPGVANEGWPLLHAIAGAGEYVGASILTLQFARGRYYEVDRASVCGERPPDADDLTAGVEDDDPARCFPPFDSCQD